MVFEGFTPEAFAFYRELEVHNERPWWLANKPRYDALAERYATD